METRNLLYVLPILFIVLGVLLSESASAEIIIINETEEDFYALEDMVLRGDLETNRLTLSGSGEVINGEDVKVYLLGRASDILIDNMKVNGRDVPVSFDDKGYYMILQEGEFAFQGDLTIRTRGQVRLYAPGPVNELVFDIQHGYAVHGNQYGLFDDEVIIQRSEKAAMLVDGGFKYSYAERNEFTYQLSYRAFGQSLGQAVLYLRSGEQVISVSGASDYSVQDGKLVLELEGETANVAVTGTFNSNSLRIPLDEGRHHVLIESDPQKKITISTTAEEVDLSQSPMYPSYSNARAFLASKDNVFNVNVEQLEMFPSLAASVRRATNRIAITEKGSMLGELTYSYSNTGVDYIGVNVSGTPLYAATGYRQSVKLTKDDGQLYLSFPKTQSGTLDMIYFDSRDPLKPVDLVEVPVANTDLIVTEAETQIIVPEDYVVLWTFGADGGSELPGIESALIFVIVFGGVGYMMRKSVRYAATYVVYSAGLFYFSWALLAVSLAASIVLIVRKHVSEKSVKWMLAGAGALIVLSLMVVAFFAVVGGLFSMGGTVTRSATVDADYAVMEEAAPEVMMSKSMQILGSGEGAINVPTREGVLPVRLELPALGKTVRVTSHLIDSGNPLKVSVLLVAGWMKYLLYLIALAAGIQCARNYGRG